MVPQALFRPGVRPHDFPPRPLQSPQGLSRVQVDADGQVEQGAGRRPGCLGVVDVGGALADQHRLHACRVGGPDHGPQVARVPHLVQEGKRSARLPGNRPVSFVGEGEHRHDALGGHGAGEGGHDFGGHPVDLSAPLRDPPGQVPAPRLSLARQEERLYAHLAGQGFLQQLDTFPQEPLPFVPVRPLLEFKVVLDAGVALRSYLARLLHGLSPLLPPQGRKPSPAPALAVSASWAKVSGSLTAMSASCLRSTSTPACLRP